MASKVTPVSANTAKAILAIPSIAKTKISILIPIEKIKFIVIMIREYTENKDHLKILR